MDKVKKVQYRLIYKIKVELKVLLVNFHLVNKVLKYVKKNARFKPGAFRVTVLNVTTMLSQPCKGYCSSRRNFSRCNVNVKNCPPNYSDRTGTFKKVNAGPLV